MPTLAQLDEELKLLDAKREAVADLAAAMRKYEAAFGSAENVAAEQPAPAVSPPARRRLTFKGVRPIPIASPTEKAVLDLLDQMGEPVATNAVILLMRERGLPLPENNTTNVISARLSYSKRVKGKRGTGWWYADRPWPGEENDMLKEIEPSQDNAGDGS